MTRVVISPVSYNEAGKTERVCERLNAMLEDHPEYDVMLIDDGSTDATPQIIEEAGLPFISHPHRQGVGVAVRTAIEHARENDYDVVVIMAGNDKDRPCQVPRLMERLEEGYDFVIGSRYLPGGVEENTPLYRVIATQYVHPFVVWLTTGRRLTDTSTGFRAIRTKMFDDPGINLYQPYLKDYDCEMTILYKALTLGYKVGEVPASKIYPPHELGYTKMAPIIGWWKMLRPFFYLRLGIRG